MMAGGTVRERYVAVVTDNEDEEQRGRIRVACADLMGVDDSGEPIEYPVWIEPSFPHLAVGVDVEEDGTVDSGFFFVPNVGTTVEIELTVSSKADKSPGQSSIGNPDPRWVACLLVPGDTPSSDFTTNYPNRMGWRSRKGSIMLFDDTDGDERAIFRGPANADGLHSYISIEPDGSMLIATNLGHLINLQANGNIVIIDGYGNTYATSEGGGIGLLTNLGSYVTVGEDIQIVSGGNVTINASNAAINAAAVELGGTAVHSLIKGEVFQGLFNTHVHNFVNAFGVTAPTLTPLAPLTGTELSLVSKTE